MAYVFPNGTPAPEAMSLLTRAGAVLLVPEHLYEVYSEPELDHALLGLTLEQVTLISRYPAELLASVPTIIRNVPGVVYPSTWLLAASMFPAIDWATFEGKMAKSGLLAMNVRDAQKRPKSVLTQGPISDPDDDEEAIRDTGDGKIDDDGVEP